MPRRTLQELQKHMRTCAHVFLCALAKEYEIALSRRRYAYLPAPPPFVAHEDEVIAAEVQRRDAAYTRRRAIHFQL